MTKRKQNPINSGAMADIAFLLLIFFMVATTFHKEKSISMTLPPPYDGPVAQVAEDRVLSILVNADNEIMFEKVLLKSDLSHEIESHLSYLKDDNKLPIINITMHPESDYQSYLNILSDVKYGIKQYRVSESMRIYKKDLRMLSRDEFRKMTDAFPIRITESQSIII